MIPQSIDEVILEVDGEEVTLQSFIQCNVTDELQVTVEDLQHVLSLKPGKSANIGMVEVKRVK